MRSLAYLATYAWLLSCTQEQVKDSMTGSELAGTTSDSLSSASWALLTGARIYFGHQSVGGNIIEGLRDLSAAHADTPLRMVRSRDRSPIPSALVEFTIGENDRPESKMKDFAAALEQIGETTPAIAIFKYCYLDITPGTNVDLLFASHRQAVNEIRLRHPNLTFVHVTAPLTRLESGPGYLAKRLLGKPTTREANANRNRFNAMLREEYAGEPLFDLAKVESTHPDRSRSFFRNGGDIVYTLAPELTDDGGHLNAAGRRAAAEEFAVAIGRVVASR